MQQLNIDFSNKQSIERQIGIWKPVDGFPLYEVSNTGQVRSIDTFIRGKFDLRRWKGRIIKTHTKRNTGYVYAQLGRDATRLVHRLVAQAFIPNPLNKRCVNHRDGNKSNNCASNLEWCTHSENELHSYKVLGKIANMPFLGKRGAECVNSKRVGYYINGELRLTFDTVYLCAEHFNKHPTAIAKQIRNGGGVYKNLDLKYLDKDMAHLL